MAKPTTKTVGERPKRRGYTTCPGWADGPLPEAPSRQAISDLYLNCNCSDCDFLNMRTVSRRSKEAQSVMSGQARMLLMQLDEQRLSVILTEMQKLTEFKRIQA